MSRSGVYVLGALLSSGMFILAVDMTAGRFSRDVLGGDRSRAAALVLVSVLILIDAIRLWGGRSTSFGPNRQTPYAWRARGWPGVLGWGLDTGVPLTTIRTSSLPVLGVVLVATGHGGPLHGLAYGSGLAVGLLGGVVAMSPRGDIRSVMAELLRRRRALRPVMVTVAPSALMIGVLVTAALAAPGTAAP